MKKSDGTFMSAIASTNLGDFLRPRETGEQINAHVVSSVREPQPNFIAMQNLISTYTIPVECENFIIKTRE
jgi:hypothetical protein